MTSATDNRTTLAIIDWLRQNDTEALVDRIGCGVYSKCECCAFAKYIGHGSSCLDAWKAMGSYIEKIKDEGDGLKPCPFCGEARMLGAKVVA